MNFRLDPDPSQLPAGASAGVSAVLYTGQTLTSGQQAQARTNIGAGTVTTFSVTTANGVSGSVANAGTTPAITLTLGAITPASVNGLTITATTGVLTVANGKTLTGSNTLTFTGTDGSTVAFGAGGTAAYTGNKLSAFAATTSAELRGVITDETGTGSLVFAQSPALGGTPSTPTPAPDTTGDRIASCGFVAAALPRRVEVTDAAARLALGFTELHIGDVVAEVGRTQVIRFYFGDDTGGSTASSYGVAFVPGGPSLEIWASVDGSSGPTYGSATYAQAVSYASGASGSAIAALFAAALASAAAANDLALSASVVTDTVVEVVCLEVGEATAALAGGQWGVSTEVVGVQAGVTAIVTDRDALGTEAGFDWERIDAVKGVALTALSNADSALGQLTGKQTARTELSRLGLKAANLASAATTSIEAVSGDFIDISGTATITSFGSGTAGAERVLRFLLTPTLTHNATSLILPGGANITAAAGDVALMRSLGGSNWVCVAFRKGTETNFGRTLGALADAAALRNAGGASSGVWPRSLGGTGATSLPRVLAWKTSDQTFPNAATTRITWVEVEDTDNCFITDPSPAAASNRFTAPRAGTLIAQVNFYHGGASSFVEFYKNGARYLVKYIASSPEMMQAMIPMAAGDYFELFWQDAYSLSTTVFGISAMWGTSLSLLFLPPSS